MTKRDVMQLHCERGGWWQLVVDDRGALVLGAAVEDGWVNSFPWADFDPDDDGLSLAHDIGLEVSA